MVMFATCHMVSEASVVQPLFNTKDSPSLFQWRDKTSGCRTTFTQSRSQHTMRRWNSYTVLVTCLRVATVSGPLCPYHTISIATYTIHILSVYTLITQLHVAMCDRFSLCHPQAIPNHSPNAIPFLPPSPSS